MKDYRRFDVALGKGRVREDLDVRSWERRNLHKSVNYMDYVIGFARLFAVFSFLVGAGLTGVWASVYAPQVDGGRLALAMLMGGLVTAGVGGGAAQWIRAGQFNEILEEQEHVELMPPQPAPDPEPAKAQRVRIPDGRGNAASFLQPKPGEFANWAAAVLRDADDRSLAQRDRTTLSQNTAEGRGWPRGMYKDMLAQLMQLGWLREGKNRVPVPTARGKTVLRAWLENRPPTPS